MSIEHVLAVVPVSDLRASSRWYEALFGRPADNNPIPTLAEWQVVPGAVDDLEAHVAELRQRGLQPGDFAGANKVIRLSAPTDPDGNTISLIGGFRVQY